MPFTYACSECEKKITEYGNCECLYTEGTIKKVSLKKRKICFGLVKKGVLKIVLR